MGDPWSMDSGEQSYPSTKLHCMWLIDSTFSSLEVKTKKTTPGFPHILGIFEMRRHAPGVLRQLSAKDNSYKESTPLKGSFLVVNLSNLPTSIRLETAEVVSHDGTGASNIEFGMEIVAKTDGEQLPVNVHMYRGGRTGFYTPFSIPTSLLKDVEGVVYDPETSKEFPNPMRFPATDGKGKGLPFIMDEIDVVMVEARETFRPPKRGDGIAATASPKTIYDYVEQKVAGSQREVWTTGLHARKNPFQGENM